MEGCAIAKDRSRRLAARWLALAASPTFVAMALLNGSSADAAASICSAADGGNPFGGMTAMYALMAAFHLGPWLRLASCGRAERPDTQGETR